MRQKSLWTMWGTVKQVIGQMSIYFSVVSMIGIAVTMWHTTISPILESHSVSISVWWVITLSVLLFVMLGIIEWRHSTPGFFRSWTQLFYTPDNPLRKDIEELKKAVAELKTQQTK